MLVKVDNLKLDLEINVSHEVEIQLQKIINYYIYAIDKSKKQYAIEKNQSIICECGKKVAKRNVKYHETSKYHLTRITSKV